MKIGDKVRLEGFGVYSGYEKEATLFRVTKTQVVLQYGSPDPNNPKDGKVRYRLRTGVPVGDYRMSGYQILRKYLERLRALAPTTEA